MCSTAYTKWRQYFYNKKIKLWPTTFLTERRKRINKGLYLYFIYAFFLIIFEVHCSLALDTLIIILKWLCFFLDLLNQIQYQSNSAGVSLFDNKNKSQYLVSSYLLNISVLYYWTSKVFSNYCSWCSWDFVDFWKYLWERKHGMKSILNSILPWGK